MSQEKVELRKVQKGNVKADVKKAKTKSLIITIVIAAIAVVIVAWIGISIFLSAKKKAETAEKQVNLDAIQTYMEELDTEINGSDEETEAE